MSSIDDLFDTTQTTSNSPFVGEKDSILGDFDETTTTVAAEVHRKGMPTHFHAFGQSKACKEKLLPSGL